eukprot:CAMPEP_0206440656 /NCGR_PEP_ID=MMETSP0324_2-20121206/12866_1 /ASSEMBLY_ACC=CAM_ASM_000836 /TAXON_ID=2866 /ORGANISM="Crypthecodinium cohnii, Strain Seligo" /LENGTH=725 /DNA_ID=CAMNT_0053908369 /DNA_START=45 /DNA_END=2222 /DNA_ORIENTATION=+
MNKLLVLAVAAANVGTTGAANLHASANPIRKVVTLLQAMQQKVTAEGEKAQELYEKFECYCKTSGGDLGASIEAAEAKLEEVAPAIEASTSKKAKIEEELTASKEEREACKTAMAEATALREKEKAAFDALLGDSKANLVALDKAIAALEGGMSGSFLQTTAASTLRRLVAGNKDLDDDDRQTLLSFLSSDSEYAPASGEIVGILKTIKDEMFASQKDAIATEEAAVKSFEELTAAKKKEVAALSKAIEAKLERSGALGLEIATLKNDLGDTSDTLEDDKKFLADLEKNCATKKATHEEEVKTRGEELVALADTIKVLNDDDALDLFKKTLPSPATSFVQVQTSSATQRAKALSLLSSTASSLRAAEGRHHLDIVMLALSGKKVGFEKVVKLIDGLVSTLKQEQADEEAKKEYCNKEFDSTDDQKKALTNKIADLETLIAEAQESVASVSEEIAALKTGIKALDKSVAEATEQRKAENADFKDLMANDAAAKELILFAKNRLNKFYNPKLYKAPAKQELSEEDQIFVNNGGTPPPTEAPGGIAGTGIEVPAFVQLSASASGSKAAPPPPPETAEAYKAKGEESNGVIAMMDLLVKDLTKEMTTAEAEEKASQASYEKTMADAAEKRALDSKSLNNKEASKANLKAELEGFEGEHASAGKSLEVLEALIMELKNECDWLLKYFDVRKQARAEEVDSLEKAKSVLAGADYSFLQRSSSSRKYLRSSA